MVKKGKQEKQDDAKLFHFKLLFAEDGMAWGAVSDPNSLYSIVYKQKILLTYFDFGGLSI